MSYPAPSADDLALAERVVDFLNGLLELDRAAVAALVANRVPCNEALANHRSVQVGAQHGGFHVGMLGVLNGLCGVGPDRYGFIQAVFGDMKTGGDGTDLLRFELRPPTTEAKQCVGGDCGQCDRIEEFVAERREAKE